MQIYDHGLYSPRDDRHNVLVVIQPPKIYI